MNANADLNAIPDLQLYRTSYAVWLRITATAELLVPFIYVQSILLNLFGIICGLSFITMYGEHAVEKLLLVAIMNAVCNRQTFCAGTVHIDRCQCVVLSRLAFSATTIFVTVGL